MPPIPPSSDALPRLIVYHQTHHDRTGKPISALPLIGSGVTHVYIAAIHLNDDPEAITLNDHHPDHERNTQLWDEVKQLQGAGIQCLGMLGGAARGSYEKLDKDFEAYYKPLRNLISAKKLDGLDLDIEEPTSLALTTKVLQRLRSDFGSSFLLTLAPVMPALLPLKPYLTSFCYRLLHPELPAPTPLIRAFIKAHLLPSHSHMSGFNHFELESSDVGKLVSWYNVQFYCGWGDAGDERLYEAIISSGWDPRKVVLGVVTNPENGSGFVDTERLGRCVGKLREKYGDTFGGVMGWEYFNAGGIAKPEQWVKGMARLLGKTVTSPAAGESSSIAAVSQATPISGMPVSAPSDTADIQAALQDATLIGGAADFATPSATAAAPTPSAPAPATALLGAERPSELAQGASGLPQDAKVQHLVEMGFDRAEAVAALEAMGGDVDAAAGLLFGD